MRRLAIVGERGLRLTCDVPVTRRERMHGLRARSSLGTDEALLLWRCSSVHTFGMRFPIRVVRLDGSLVVVETRILGPGRLLRPSRGVRHVLECHPRVDVRPGDRLRVVGEPAEVS